ncbi:MAG: hypothetical protein KDG89_08280 [Geminicoccaceae bacterium]|nr:hypothetical protein [Geminicoccaceae bacterium]
MVVRTGDTALNARLSSLMQGTQTRMRDRQTDIATGKSAHRYAEIGDQAALLLRTKEHLASLGTLTKQNEVSLTRVQAVDDALGHVADQMIRMQSLLNQRLNDPAGSLVPVDAEADGLMREVASTLNAKLGDRYLFAGSRTDTRPVDLPAAIAGAADVAGFYKGDALPTKLRMDRDAEVALDVNAGQFAALFETLADAKAAHLAGDADGLRTANDRLGEQIASLAQQRGRVGATMARMEGIVDGQRATSDYLGQVASGIEDTDLPTAMSQLSQDRVTLEAAYLTISRISNLSLADFMR